MNSNTAKVLVEYIKALKYRTGYEKDNLKGYLEKWAKLLSDQKPSATDPKFEVLITAEAVLGVTTGEWARTTAWNTAPPLIK